MKKILLAFLLAIGLFFPVISTHLAFKNAENIRNDEIAVQISNALTIELQQMGQTYGSLVWLHSGMKKLLENTGSKNYKSFLNRQLPDFVRKIPFPVEIECVVIDNTASATTHRYLFGTNLGLSTLRSDKNEKRCYVAKTNDSGAIINSGNRKFYTALYKSAFEALPRELTQYQKQSIPVLSCRVLSDGIYVFILTDLNNLDLKKSITIKTSFYDRSDMGVGVCFENTAEPVFSEFFDKVPELKSYIADKVSHNVSERWLLRHSGYQIAFSGYDYKLKCRFFAAKPLLPTEKSSSSGPIIVILGIISCVLFKYVMEKFFLGRGRDFSIKTLLPAFFIFLIIIPVFAGAGYVADFFYSSYANEKERVVETLAGDLNETDLQSRDLFRAVINELRFFNSFEDIESFSKSLYSGNDAEFICNFLDKFEIKGFEGLSLCLVPFGKNAVKTYYNNQFQRHMSDKVDNPLTSMFVWRADEMIKTMGIIADNADKNKDHRSLRGNQELKIELARDIFLKTIGSESYYRFRQNNDPLFSFKTKYRNYYYLFKLFFCKNRPYAYSVWEFKKGTHASLFPVDRLRLLNESPRLAFTGEYSNFKSHVYNLSLLRQRFPELVNVAEQAYHTRSTVSGTIETASQTVILAAKPGNFTPDVLAGSENLENYPAFIARVSWQAARSLLLLILTGFFIAWVGALYFTVPLQKLTEATRQIHVGNFAFRINAEHPDEFRDIANSFNAMAHRLEEGERLKSFVSNSVIREVTESGDKFTADSTEARYATIIFSSINDFKEFQAGHSAAEVFALLQTHLQVADAAVHSFGGEIDKMIEDKVMIVFEHDADTHVVESAIHIARTIAERMQAQAGAKISIGINSGMTIAGIMGAETARLSRTVVGDPVNLAARLSYVASQQAEGGIVISGHLKDFLPEGFTAETLPIRHVKGKTQEVEACLVSLHNVSERGSA